MTKRGATQVAADQAAAYKAGDVALALKLHHERMALAVEAQKRAGIVLPQVTR